MSLPAVLQRHKTKLLLGAGVASLSFSVFLMYLFTLQIRDVKEIALPAALALPALEKRLVVLQEQTELGELQEALGSGPQDEKVRMYILPAHDEIDRLIQTMDVFLQHWQQLRIVTHVTPLSVGTASGVTLEGVAEPLSATRIFFEADVTPQGLEQLLLFIDIAGNLTVSDALTLDARQQLLRLTEEENPAAVTVLEQFLSTDLLSYVRDPAAVERQLLRAFSTDRFGDALQTVLHDSDLPKIEALLTKDIVAAMDEAKLWPIRMLRITNMSITPVTEQLSHVAVTLEAIARGN